MKLGESGKKDKVIVFEEGGYLWSDKVNRVPSKKSGFGGFLEGIGYSYRGGGIFAEVTKEKVEISRIEGVVEFGRLVERAGRSGWVKRDLGGRRKLVPESIWEGEADFFEW